MNKHELEARPQEIERKFLVEKSPSTIDQYDCVNIRQGYMVIGEDGSEARLRDKAGSYFMTVKSKGDLVRGEWETAISAKQFNALWRSTEGKRVEKVRYTIFFEGHEIELDVYEGALEGLITAEVEFASEHDARVFEPPEWFGPEVTQDTSFKNQQLALYGHDSL